MSMSVASLLVVLVSSACLWPISNASVAEGEVLLNLSRQWVNVEFPSWVAGGDPCGILPWENVTCEDGYVTTLNVSNRGIIGSLDGIGGLVHLQVLDVSNSGSSDYKTLSQNQFRGGIPDSLFTLTTLRILNLSTITWSADRSFPSQIVKLTNLEEFQMSGAELTGSIPPDFFSLHKIRVLYLGNNSLTVSLASFTTFTQRQVLSLFSLNLNTTIPQDFAVALPNLTYINLHDCGLYGPLPDNFGSLMNLQTLLLYNNELSGRIPTSWARLQNLTTLRLNDNYVSGPFPMWLLTSMSSLKMLYLEGNFFWDQAPDYKAYINKFALLRYDCNYLNGTDPQKGIAYNKSSPYQTRYNCYNGASPSDLDKVVSECGTHKSAQQSCSDFYAQIVNAARPRCPPCPRSQNVLPSNPDDTPCVCGYTPASKRPDDGVPAGAVIGGAFGLFVIFVVLLGIVLWKRRAHFSFLDKFMARNEGPGHWEVPPGVQRFSLEELSRITDNFSDSHVLGEGGFGKVFRGSLEDGRMVAIKRASADRAHGLGEFRNEVMLLSRLHHRHLVKLEGFCEEGGLEILVYEYMTKGNLHAHLLGKGTRTPLHWYKRLEIAVGVAQGLEYLHSFADPPVIHRDVKPSNILLDENMVAKVADFGISKVTAEADTHVSTRPAGTAGYLDPEYFLRRQLSTASDVYAYGVVLLELVTGQEAIDHKRVEEYNLIEWTKKRFKAAGIVSIIDPIIDEDYPREVYSVMADLGLQCASFNKNERPSMKDVLSTLEPELTTYSQYLVASRSQGASRTKSRRAEPIISATDQPSGSEASTATDPEADLTVVLLSETMGPR